MKLLKDMAGRTIRWVPRPRSLLAVYQLYYARFQAAAYENNPDIHTNGERRLLQEVAAHIEVAFDVGANVGEWTSLLLALTPRVSRLHAFEPCSSAFARLVDRSFPPCVSPHHMGLSSKPGTGSLYILGEANPNNSLYQRQGLEDGWGIRPADATEEVLLETIDRFCEQNGIRWIDFLKIDAEGHDVDVLEGARESLRRGVIKIVQFEYGGPYIDSRRLLKDVFEIVAGLDYTVFLITPDRLVAYPRYDQRLENFQYKNFAIFHREAVARSPSAKQALARTLRSMAAEIAASSPRVGLRRCVALPARAC